MKRVIGVLVAVALAAGCGGPGTRNVKAYPRQSLLVLYQKKNSDECRIKGASAIHAFRGDRVEWQVWNLCDRSHRVEVTFASVPGTTSDLAGDLAADGNRTLSLQVDAAPGTYKYSLVVDGTTQVDPDLEIDPFSS